MDYLGLNSIVEGLLKCGLYLQGDLYSGVDLKHRLDFWNFEKK